MKTIKIIGLTPDGQYKDIYHHMPQDSLPLLVKKLLAHKDIGMVMLEQEPDDPYEAGDIDQIKGESDEL